MKTTTTKFVITMLAGSATSALASVNNAGHGGNGMLIWGFLGFGAVVLLLQSVPAVTIFFSTMMDLLSSTPSEASLPIRKDKNNK